MASQTIGKLEAACRLLNTAIVLWFNDGDAVSIHTLACSAYQIVQDINCLKGGTELLYDSIIIMDKYRREAITYLKKHYNFFKHADKDPDGTIEFDPKGSEGFILFTSLGLELLGRSPDDVRGAFNIYYALHNHHLLNEKGKSVLINSIPKENREYTLSMPKQQFFEAYTHLRKLHLLGQLKADR